MNLTYQHTNYELSRSKLSTVRALLNLQLSPVNYAHFFFALGPPYYAYAERPVQPAGLWQSIFQGIFSGWHNLSLTLS